MNFESNKFKNNELNNKKVIRDNEKLFQHVSNWRVISSGVVSRKFDSSSDTKSECSTNDKASISENVSQLENNLLQSSNWAESLRKPIKYQKPKKLLEDGENGPRLTRNCEQLFSQLKSTHCLPKQKTDVDPSFSVRRIVQRSGLLESFGTGLLRNDEIDDRSEYYRPSQYATSENEFVSKETQPFDVNAFIYGPTLPSTTNGTELWKKDSYDTVLMQKTVETEVVQYMPTEDIDADIPSSPSNLFIAGKKEFRNTPANGTFKRKNKANYEKFPKSKKPYLMDTRYFSESSDNENQFHSLEFF